MQICSIQSFNGKNIYSHRPVVKIVVDLEELYDTPTKDIQGFNERLLSIVPGLYKHRCTPGHEGGFVERLKEGTYIAHVTEHLILELQMMLGYDVFFGKARLAKEPSIYNIVYEFMDESCGIECGRAALSIVSSLVNGIAVDSDGIFSNLARVKIESELGPSTKAIYDEARARGIPVVRLGSESLLQLGYGKYSRLIEASLSDAPSCVNVDIAGNKHLTKQMLIDNKIPVPSGDIAYTVDSAGAIAQDIGYPVVIKPFNANQGKGVTLNVSDAGQLGTACMEAVKHSKAVIVEKFVEGRDYRVLVVGNKISAVSERRPPFITGDGKHTVGQLVEIENNNPLRGYDHEKPLTKIKLDVTAAQLLVRYGLNEEYVPARGEKVVLRENGNLSTGGTARECTDEIHPYNAEIAIKTAQIMGLDIAGVDIIAEDIGIPLDGSNGTVIEVNAAPGLRMHIHPSVGNPRNVAADIVDMLFPVGKPYSVPIVSVTGTNGKTTTVRLINHTLALFGLKVGMTTTSGVYVGEECILEGDNTGPVSARMILSRKDVEVAVLETARGGMVKRGLGYEFADVGVVTNIGDDHLGIDEVNTLEELAFIKSLVIEAVKPDGYSVLNADDPMTEYLMKRAVGNRILFSKSKSNPLLMGHMSEGGKAIYLDNNMIFLYDGAKSSRFIGIDEIPITFGGAAECNIENSMSAACSLYALNIPLTVIKAGLRTFKPDAASNPGRFNIFDFKNFKVMLDYGHNPAGCSEVIKFMERSGSSRLVGVIGMPGDRLDRSIREFGEMCGKSFGRLYIKEDSDLRGRDAGEVAGIIFDAVIKTGMRKENVDLVFSEVKALETAILDAQPGDFIVMLYEEFEPALELVDKFMKELQGEEIENEIMMTETAG